MFKSTYLYLKEWMNNLWCFFCSSFKSRLELQLEILELRSQLALVHDDIKSKKITKPNSTLAFRQLWVLLSKHKNNWKENLILVVPATVISWHDKIRKWRWRRISNKGGRPPISDEVIEKILMIHDDNPFFSPEKIHELLAIQGLKNPPAPNTIAKYLPDKLGPTSYKSRQTWSTFLDNHSPDIWATDFFTTSTLTFNILYVLVIIKHSNREIVHFAVTQNPNMFWLKQQFRNATPYDKSPKYLIHDNDPVFNSKVFQDFLADAGIESKATSVRSPWQNPYAERVIGTLRRELLDHLIPINEIHLERLLDEYVNDYYNTHRTHQGIDCKTPIPKPEYIPVDIENFKLKSTPVLNGLYHTYERVS